MRTPNSIVLLTAFEPFGGDTINASERAVRVLDGRVIGSHRVVVVILPCRFGDAASVLHGAMQRERPSLVVACGEAAGRAEIAIERVAINVDDARIPDNAGAQPLARPIAPDGPAAYASTLPIDAIARALAGAGIPASVSHSAGTFVCNHVFYELMRALPEPPGVRGGFVHVPACLAQAKTGSPAMATEMTAAALEIVIATSLRA